MRKEPLEKIDVPDEIVKMLGKAVINYAKITSSKSYPFRFNIGGHDFFFTQNDKGKYVYDGHGACCK